MNYQEPRRCVECGESFVITDGNVRYFVERSLALPKRCEPCRRVAREHKQEAFGEITLDCRLCDQPFVLTSGEQQFFASHGLRPPKTCRACRDLRRRSRGGADEHGSTL
jgi:hypothetical protein